MNAIRQAGIASGMKLAADVKTMEAVAERMRKLRESSSPVAPKPVAKTTAKSLIAAADRLKAMRTKTAVSKKLVMKVHGKRLFNVDDAVDEAIQTSGFLGTPYPSAAKKVFKAQKKLERNKKLTDAWLAHKGGK